MVSFLTPGVVVGDSCHPTRAHPWDTFGVECMHEFGFAGVDADNTNSPAELLNKAAEKPRYGEEILDPTTVNPYVSCPAERTYIGNRGSYGRAGYYSGKR